jgi:hypothetical protein
MRARNTCDTHSYGSGVPSHDRVGARYADSCFRCAWLQQLGLRVWGLDTGQLCESWLTLPASTGYQADHLFRVMALPPRSINVRCVASSADQRPVDPDGAASPPPRRRRPWGWIAACVLLVVVAGGLAIWALGLNSDLDDQRDQTAQAQQQAAQASREVETLSGEIDQISQTVTDAGDQLSQAGAEAQQNAQTTLDGLGTKLDSIKGEAASVKDRLDKAAKQSKSSEGDTAP